MLTKSLYLMHQVIQDYNPCYMCWLSWYIIANYCGSVKVMSACRDLTVHDSSILTCT